jgi:hypothetical protein
LYLHRRADHPESPGHTAVPLALGAVLGCGFAGVAPLGALRLGKLFDGFCFGGLWSSFAGLGIMLELLRSFPELLGAKKIEYGTVLFLDGDGCPMECNYPGRMVAKASRFLRARSVDLWPEASLTLIPADDLRIRAEKVLRFLRNVDLPEGDSN